MHLYIIYNNNPASKSLANAGFCAINNIYKRPTYGRVLFNIGTMTSSGGNHSIFEDDLETTIHEILHVLGFSSNSAQFWIDPATNDFYGKSNVSKIIKTINIRGKPTIILFSENVLKTARKYYNCTTLEGM